MWAASRGVRAVAVSVVILVLVGLVRSFNLAGADFFPFAAAGIALVLCLSKPLVAELWGSVVWAILLVATYALTGGQFGQFPYARAEDALAFWGLGSAVILGRRLIHRGDGIAEFLTALTFPVFAIVAVLALGLCSASNQNVYDLYLHRFDASFGFQASSIVAQWFQNIPLVHAVCQIAYQALPLMQVAAISLYLRSTGRFPRFPVFAFGLAGMLGCLLYQVVPAVGPVHVFGPSFAYRQNLVDAVGLITLDNPAPRNSVPSLHLAWALLILWNVPQRNRAGVRGAGGFVVLIVLATLGLGEHYLVDLVIAVPFAACVQNTCAGRWRPVLVSGAITASWLWYMRFLLPYVEPHFGTTWAATLVTVSLPLWLQVRRVEAPIPRLESEERLVLSEA